MEHEEAGCQAPPEGPILCINNCGFFGSSSNMNMCSKCYKDLMLKQEQAQIAASSIENIVNGSSSGTEKEEESPLVQTDSVQLKPISAPSLNTSLSSTTTSAEAAVPEPKPKAGPSRCSTCNKRVGLTGFKCRCGDLFCGSHRYSDKHNCPFDYRSAGRDAIAMANPVVKAEKLEKI